VRALPQAVSRVRFSKARPTRLVCGGVDGSVYIYDLHVSKTTSQQVVRPPAGSTAGAGAAAPTAAAALVAMELSGAEEEVRTLIMMRTQMNRNAGESQSLILF
jgi:hypothetical protein